MSNFYIEISNPNLTKRMEMIFQSSPFSANNEFVFSDDAHLLANHSSKVKVLIINKNNSILDQIFCIKSGIFYSLDISEPQHLINNQLTQISNKQIKINASMAEAILKLKPFIQLSSRQEIILKKFSRGLNCMMVAESLGVHCRDIKANVLDIFTMIYESPLEIEKIKSSISVF